LLKKAHLFSYETPGNWGPALCGVVTGMQELAYKGWGEEKKGRVWVQKFLLFWAHSMVEAHLQNRTTGIAVS